MIRYAITAGNCRAADVGRDALRAQAEWWAEARVDYVQLREKALGAGDLLTLAKEMQVTFREHGERTRLLINGRVDVALAAGAAGVHLTSHPDELAPEQVRRLFAGAAWPDPVVSVSCHTIEEVRRASAAGADFVLFGPVFEKSAAGNLIGGGSGLDALRKACEAAAATPVLALGGISAESAGLCVEAGTAGIAGIRLFGSREGFPSASGYIMER